MRKISLAELKKTVQWIEANTNSATVFIDMCGDAVVVKSIDRNEESVEITLYDTERCNMLPKITKTERL